MRLILLRRIIPHVQFIKFFNNKINSHSAAAAALKRTAEDCTSSRRTLCGMMKPLRHYSVTAKPVLLKWVYVMSYFSYISYFINLIISQKHAFMCLNARTAASNVHDVLLALSLTAYGGDGRYMWEVDDDTQFWRALKCVGWKIYKNRDTGALVYARPSRRSDSIFGPPCGLYHEPRCFVTLSAVRRFLRDHRIDGFGNIGALNEHVVGVALVRSVRHRAIKILVSHLCSQRCITGDIEAELIKYIGFDMSAPATSAMCSR